MESMTFIKHPRAPRVGLVTTETVFRYMLDESNTAVVQFTVVDADTATADVTMTLRTTLSATVARIGNTNDFALTISVSAPSPLPPQCPLVGHDRVELHGHALNWACRIAWMCWRAHTAPRLLAPGPTSCLVWRNYKTDACFNLICTLLVFNRRTWTTAKCGTQQTSS